MFSRHHRKVKLLFTLADALLAALAFEAAYRTRLDLQFERVFYLTTERHTVLLGFAMLAWPVLASWLNVYDRPDSSHPKVILRDGLKQSAFGIVAVVLFQFVLRLDLSRLFLALLGLYSWIALCLFRLNAPRLAGWIRAGFGAPHHVWVVGAGERARRMGALLERSAPYGVRLMGFLEDTPGEAVQLDRGYQLRPISSLPSLLKEEVVDEVIFCVGSERLAALEDMLLLCDEDGVRTRVAVDFFPHVNSEVYLDRLDHVPLLSFAAAPHDEVLLFLKRTIDVLLAGAALVLIAPFMILLGALIKLTSPGPAIFKQVRCGLNGRRFTFYKFRSMVANAEELKPTLEHLNEKDVVFKIPNDPRQTALGRYLRRFSIDEWPQLWNVLKGDMSLVGPRPAVPGEVERYQRWQRRRLRMRPGLTCLWALEGRDALDFDTWMRKDMEYIDNWSLALDWKIILHTIPRVLLGKGAH